MKSLIQQSGLSQVVKTRTRKNNMPDVFFTNAPSVFGKVCCSKNLMNTDHLSVFVLLKERNPPVRSIREFFDVRDCRRRLMFEKLKFVKLVFCSFGRLH